MHHPLLDWCHRHKVIGKVLLLLSLAGFLYQVSLVSEHYFKYETVTQVHQTPRDSLRPGNIVFCPRYLDIVDKDRVFNETGIQLRRIVDSTDSYEMEGLLTVEQVYNYTPAAETAMSGCALRGPNNRIVSYKGKECQDLWNVTKFFTQEYMCYLMILKDRKYVPLYDITTSSVGQYIVSVVYMSDEFASAEFGTAVMAKNTVPTVSRHYSRSFHIRNLSDGTLRTNRVNMRAKFQVSLRLEKPYDTMCVNVSYKVPIFCVKECLIAKYKTIDRIPAEELLLKPYPVKPLSQRDMKDNATAVFVRESKAECNKKCNVIPCRLSFGFTSLQEDTDVKRVMRLGELSPGEADLTTISQPNMLFIEYFSFICSCFGTWFGLSFLSLDPFTWKSHVREYLASKQ